MLNFDDIGIGQVRRVMKMLGKLRNFRSLSKTEKSKAVVLPLIFASGFGVTALQGHQVIKHLNLSQADKGLMAECVSNYDEDNLLFEDGVDTKAGCACTVKLVASDVPTSHYSYFKTAHKLALQSYFIEGQGETETAITADYERQLTAMVTAQVRSAEFNSAQLGAFVDIIGTADMTCSDSTLYAKANLVKLGALEPYTDMIFVDETQGVVELTLRGAQAPVRLSQN